MGQICDTLNEREMGKFPSQPQQNPKGAFQASTSTCNESSHDQLNAVTTLRSGKVVYNNVSMTEKSESVSKSSLHKTPHNTTTTKNESAPVFKSKSSIDVFMPSNVPVAPFPQRLEKQNKGT